MSDTIVERKDLETRLRFTGDLVAARVPELRSQLRAAVAEGARDVILDFTEVAMVDSAGLGLLIAAHNSLKKAGGQLSVVHASKELLDLFRSMRIHKHFSVSGD